MMGHPDRPAYLPEGYSVRPALFWRRWRAQCPGWTGGLCGSRTAAVWSAWQHHVGAGYHGPERRRQCATHRDSGTWYAAEDELL